MPKTWTDTKPGSNIVKWEEKIDWFKFSTPKDGVEFNHIRPVGPINSAAYHWIDVIKRDGGKTCFPMTCSDYNSETEETIVNTCPACKVGLEASKFYFQNAIIRTLQEDKPAKAINIKNCPDEINKNFREPGDKHWSPIRVVKIPKSCAGQLRDIVKLNRHKINGKLESKDISDVKYGCDIYIKFDKEEKNPANKYNVQKGDVVELTEEEKKYKLYNLEIIETDVKKNLKDLTRLGYLGKPKINEEDMPETNNLPEVPTEEMLTDDNEINDHLTMYERKDLKQYVKNHSIDIKIFKTDSDDDIRNKIRGVEKPACFGSYDGSEKCFECNYRSSCIDNESGTDSPF